MFWLSKKKRFELRRKSFDQMQELQAFIEGQIGLIRIGYFADKEHVNYLYAGKVTNHKNLHCYGNLKNYQSLSQIMKCELLMKLHAGDLEFTIELRGNIGDVLYNLTEKYKTIFYQLDTFADLYPSAFEFKRKS